MFHPGQAPIEWVENFVTNWISSIRDRPRVVINKKLSGKAPEYSESRKESRAGAAGAAPVWCGANNHYSVRVGGREAEYWRILPRRRRRVIEQAG